MCRKKIYCCAIHTGFSYGYEIVLAYAASKLFMKESEQN